MVLNTFKDLPLNDTGFFSDVVINLEPQSGSVADFDFDMSI